MRVFRRGGSRPLRQRRLPTLERAERRERGFKRAIAGLTALAVVAALGGTAFGRHAVGGLALRAKWLVRSTVGLEPSRADRDLDARLARARSIAWTRPVYRDFFHRRATDAWRGILAAADLTPEKVLLRWANGNGAVVFSPRVFAPDDAGRSYRMRPRQRAFWTANHILSHDLGSFLLLPDTPAVRAAVAGAHESIMTDSSQTTNSWGCRGPEPDTDADLRVLVLGDSFMQGVFTDDASTPPVNLERVLAARTGKPVSVLNTGHIGYSPEQYYFTLREYFDRFRPHSVVLSVCPNDFGYGPDVLDGRGDWPEGLYWLDEIRQFCRTARVPIVVVAVPVEWQVIGYRVEGNYQGRLASSARLASAEYLNPLDAFVDEHLRIRAERPGDTRLALHSSLYNSHVHDGHFSPQGSALWARLVGRRVLALLRR